MALKAEPAHPPPSPGIDVLFSKDYAGAYKNPHCGAARSV